jgi:hypothetical protein
MWLYSMIYRTMIVSIILNIVYRSVLIDTIRFGCCLLGAI